MQRKVSVIVPIYNVEPYLKKCVDSIINQSYTNLEIILVDDGSTDSSGLLCEELAKNDDRITVVHKNNGGLSDARNAGLDISTGDYIGFVDSDDYIDSDFFEILVKNIEEYNADVSCCRYTNVWENGRKEPIGNDDSLSVYEGKVALKEYLYAKTMDPFVWNKLFKASIIENHRFIKGIQGEDNPFCIELFKKTDKVVLAGKSKYNYLQERTGAITNSNINQKGIDSVFYWDKVRRDCHTNIPELEKYALRRQVLFYIGLFNDIYNSQEFKKCTEEVRMFIKIHLNEIRNNDVCEKIIKTASSMIARTPHLYIVVMKVYKKIVGRTKL